MTTAVLLLGFTVLSERWLPHYVSILTLGRFPPSEKTKRELFWKLYKRVAFPRTLLLVALVGWHLTFRKPTETESNIGTALLVLWVIALAYDFVKSSLKAGRHT